MKFQILLLASTILLLSAKPGIDAVSLQLADKQACCAGHCEPFSKNENPQEKNKGCEGKSCTPFQICSSWTLFCLAIPLDHLPKSVVLTNSNFVYQSNFTSYFIPDFWQPPKIV